MHSPRVLLTSLLWFLLVGVVACGDNPSNAPTTLSVSPSTVVVMVGESQTITATYTDADGATSPASDATFAVQGSTVATISGSGASATVRGVAAGRTVVTVTGRGATASVPVMVNGVATPTLSSIQITPIMPSFAAGTDVQLTATGTYSDNSTKDLTEMVTWESATPANITVDTKGKAHAVAVGQSVISASFGDGNAKITGTTTVTATAALPVSIQVDPTDPSRPVGLTVQLTVTEKFSDNTTQIITDGITWTTADAGKVTVSETGLATAVAVGEAVITAKLGALTDTTKVTVTAAEIDSIAVTPADPSIAAGRTQQFTAKATLTDRTVTDVTATATWSSTATSIATVSTADGSRGLATALKVGDAIIRATAGGKTGETTLHVTAALLTAIAVTPDNSASAAGTKVQFHAEGTFSDASHKDITNEVAWESSDTAKAQISNADGTRGEATTLAPGETTIKATLDGISDDTKLTVSNAVLSELRVEPETLTTPIGVVTAFKATGVFSDASEQDLTTQVTWSSSDDARATVSNVPGHQGELTAVAVGDVTVTATKDTVHDDAAVTVTPAEVVSVVVDPKTATLAIAGTVQLSAKATFTDHRTDDVTATAAWTSTADTVATVSAAGLVTAAGGGTATITATLGGKSDTAAITVAGLQVVSIVPPAGATQIRTSTTIQVTFDTAMDPASVTTQLFTDVCSGTLQVSKDNFVNCLGFASESVVFDTDKKVAIARFANTLSFTTAYKVRITQDVKTAAGVPLGIVSTQASAWTTAGTCAPGLVISQVYGGGGNTGGVFSHDFIELHNIGITAQSLAGLGIQYNSAAGTGPWIAQALPAVTIPPGGYFLIQEAVGANNPPQAELPAPDFIPTTPVSGQTVGIQMSGTQGRVALTLSPTPMTSQDCAVIRAASIDLVGYGGAACFEGAATTGTTAPTGARRLDGGCIDTNANNLDFEIVTPTPRNSAAANQQVCSCPVANLAEQGDEAQMSFLE